MYNGHYRPSYVCYFSTHAYRNGTILNVNNYSNRREKNYCRITRSPKHLLSTCFILNDIKPQYLRAWFCSYELPDPFSCMLTTIYGIPPLPTLAHQCVTMNSPSDLLFLRVRSTDCNSCLSVSSSLFLLLLLSIQSVFIRTADL